MLGKIELIKSNITDIGEQQGKRLLRISVKLKGWAKNPEPKDKPILDKEITVNYEQIEGLSKDELIKKWEKEILQKVQLVIDKYNREKELESDVKIDESILRINNIINNILGEQDGNLGCEDYGD